MATTLAPTTPPSRANINEIFMAMALLKKCVVLLTDHKQGLVFQTLKLLDIYPQ